MNDSPTSDPHLAKADALARIDAIERSLEQLSSTVRSSTTALQEELGQLRLSVIEIHSHAVSRPTPLTEPPVGGDAPEGSSAGARLVALDLVSREVDEAEALKILREAFPGIDAEQVLREVSATPGS